MIIKVLGSRDKSEEWILLELQGELVSKSVEVLSGQLIGDLHFSTQGEPMFIVGHHVLFGKLLTMKKPFVVTRKTKVNGETEYHVVGIIRKKLLFKTRPRPIICGPKTT